MAHPLTVCGLLSFISSWLAAGGIENPEDVCDSNHCLNALSRDAGEGADALSLLQVEKKAEKYADMGAFASGAIMADESLGFRWALISGTQACEDSEEDIKKLRGQGGFDLALCRDWCMAWPTCAAIDYFRASRWCNIYDKACKAPKTAKDGASSYQLQRNVVAKSQVPTKKKASLLQQWNSGAVIHKSAQKADVQRPPKTWVAISSTAACEENREGITYTKHEPGYTLETCKFECEKKDGCVAIDFYNSTSWCLLYDKACSTPSSSFAGSSSYRMVVEEEKSDAAVMMQSQSSSQSLSKAWTAISQTNACEENHEGINFMQHESGFTVETCKKKCEETSKCVAIDFYSETSWCLLYDRACSTPLRAMAGSSSHRVQVEERKPQAAAMVQTSKFPSASSSVRDVEKYMMEFGSPWAAAQMREDQIDGEAFLQLMPEDFKEYGVKRGPALKLYKHIHAAAVSSTTNNAVGSNALHEVVGPDGVLLISSRSRHEQLLRTKRKLEAISINATLLRATDDVKSQGEDLEHGCALENTAGVKESCTAAHKTGYGCTSKAEQAMATSHLRALQEAKNRNWDWTAIFEDNAVPVSVDNWSAIFRKAWQKVPPRTQMVRLGWCQIDVLDYQDPVIHHVHSNVSGAILTQRIGYGKFSGKPFVYEPGGCSTAYMVHKDILEDLISLFPCCGSVDACYKWDFLKRINPKTGVERGMEVMMNIDSHHHQLVDGVIEHHGLMVQDGDALKLSMLQKEGGRGKVRRRGSM